MQTKHLLMFAAIIVLAGAIVSMTTSGVLVAAQTNNNMDTASTDSDFVKEGLIDDDEKGGDVQSPDDDAGEQEDSEDCVEDDALEEAASEDSEGAEDEDEDVNDEEDEDAGNEDEGEVDDEENGAGTASAGSNSTGTEDESEEEEDDQVAFDPCNFNNEIDNPYLPLSKHVGKTLTFVGTSTEEGKSVDIKELWNVRSETVDIADVETLVVVVQEYEDDELVQEALQYYAQGKDGTVYNFGEDVMDYEGGVAVENDDESWTVGDDTAVPSIAMPATPATGAGFAYHSVDVPGIAHEVNEVKSLRETVHVEYGLFHNVLKVNDYDFDEGKTSQEFYAPDVGLIKEVDGDEEAELVSIA